MRVLVSLHFFTLKSTYQDLQLFSCIVWIFRQLFTCHPKHKVYLNYLRGKYDSAASAAEPQHLLYSYSLFMWWHQDALAEVEEKYRKAMVSNAQLDNEKNNLMYQVDTLKDSLMELEELLSESQRGYEEKVKVRQADRQSDSL